MQQKVANRPRIVTFEAAIPRSGTVACSPYVSGVHASQCIMISLFPRIWETSWRVVFLICHLHSFKMLEETGNSDNSVGIFAGTESQGLCSALSACVSSVQEADKVYS